jgi:hypothetical protein
MIGHRRRGDEEADQGQELVAAPLEPADGHQLRAVPAGGVGVADLEPEPVAAVGEPLRLVQPSGPDRQRDIERGHEVPQGVASVRVEPQAERVQGIGGAAVTGEEQVDGAPGQPHQPVEDPTRRRREGDQFLGQREAKLGVLRAEEAVVGQGQPLGEPQGVGLFPRRGQLGQDRLAVGVQVGLFGGASGRQPAGERRTRVELRQCLSLHRADPSPLEGRPVLVDPDPTQAEGGLRQRLGVAPLLCFRSFAPEPIPGFPEPSRLQQCPTGQDRIASRHAQ